MSSITSKWRISDAHGLCVVDEAGLLIYDANKLVDMVHHWLGNSDGRRVALELTLVIEALVHAHNVNVRVVS